MILHEVKRILTGQIQWQNVGPIALQVHVFILYCGLMSATIRVLHYELQLR